MTNKPPFDQPPAPAVGLMVWHGPELSSPATYAWSVTLKPSHIRELHVALRAAQRRGVPLLKLTAAGFPLPLGAIGLRRVAHELEHGRGFVILRGLPVAQLGPAAVNTVFWGIGQHLGVPVSQNSEGHMLGHVRDTGRDLTDPATRGYQTRARLPFHTDPADVVALLHLTAAHTGGRAALVSSAALYNAVLERRPDLATRLFRRYCVDLREEHGPGERPWDEVPLAVWHDGRLSIRYDRLLVESTQRFPEVPPLEAADIELFDLLDELAESERFRLDLDLEVGDMLLVNNHAVMHRREAYEDFDEPDRKRHLLRPLLTPHHRRPLPETFWGTGRRDELSTGRGGIAPTDVITAAREGTRPNAAAGR
ncbi:TauD/TfdA family dioxygenase [Streptomyces sparsogenes]|uniref:TauD/TfdA family dioxygenase n=1 Tax=Streptomyces sparsogenes TaxID=67365 RepID=UPI0033E0E044